jgi:hypothetical protein
METAPACSPSALFACWETFVARRPRRLPPELPPAPLCVLLSLYRSSPGLSASSAADIPKSVSRYSPCAVRLGLG